MSEHEHILHNLGQLSSMTLQVKSHRATASVSQSSGFASHILEVRLQRID